MRKLSKRVLSIITLLCIIIALLPLQTLAANTIDVQFVNDITTVYSITYKISDYTGGKKAIQMRVDCDYRCPADRFGGGYERLSPTTYTYTEDMSEGSWGYTFIDGSTRTDISALAKVDSTMEKAEINILTGFLAYEVDAGSTDGASVFYCKLYTFEIDLRTSSGTIDSSGNIIPDESQNVFPTLSENSARMFLGFIYNNSAYKTIDLSDNPEYLLLTGKIQATEYQKKLLAASFLSVLNVSIGKYISDTNYCKEYLLNGLKEELIGQLQDEKTDIIKDGIWDIIEWGANKLTNNSSYLMKELGVVMATANTINNGASAIEFVIENMKSIVYSIMLPLQSELNGRYTYFNSYISLRNSYDKDSETFKILKEYNAFAAAENNILGGMISWIPGISSWSESIQIIDEWAEYTYLLSQYINSETQSCTSCEYNIIQIQCPVDVQIYDHNEDLVAETKNNLIVKDISENDIENVQLYVFNDIKIIVFKDDIKYYLKLYANEDGKFNYVCSSIDDLGIETKRDITYDIPIKQGDIFNIRPNNISVVFQIDKDTNKEILIPISTTWFDDSPQTVSVYADTNINISAFGSDDYNLGDIVNLIAPNTSNYVFLGWYENEKLVEKDNIYTFTARENRTLEAKYTPIVHVESIRLNKTSVLFDSIGANEQLTVKLSPEGVMNSTVMWKSNNNAVATVNSNGLVTSIGNGTAIITATTQDGSYTATCEVTVALPEGPGVPVTGVELNAQKIELNRIGDVCQIEADVTPINATNQTVIWSSSNPRVATVTGGGLVTAVSNGVTPIPGTTQDGGSAVTCDVTVALSEGPVVPVTGVELNVQKIELNRAGDVYQIEADVTPINATNQTVKWVSSNPNIATVTDVGLVTAVSNGVATITAITQDGGYTATCEVTVALLEEPNIPVPVTGVELNTSRVELNRAGDIYQLKANVLPTDATNRAVTWISSNPWVATVSNNGLVTAVSEGTATITVTTEDGQKVATCTVTVHIESGSGGTGGGGSSGSTTPASYTITSEYTVGGAITISPKAASKGQTVTITAVPDEGFALETLSVTDKNGNKIELTQKNETSYTFKMPASKVTVSATFTEIVVEPEPIVLPFDDISQSAWYYGAVEYVYSNDMMQGTSATTFSPEIEMSRGMIATVLYRLENTPTLTGSISFSDVGGNEWYTDAIQWAAENGIMNGYGNKQFGPLDSVTREQLAVLLYNYTASKGISVEAAADLSVFRDAEDTSDWAEKAISWAVGVGLLSGKGNGILDPTCTATRAEVAQMLMNYCTKVVLVSKT